jgi:hypothetical protein
VLVPGAGRAGRDRSKLRRRRVRGWCGFGWAGRHDGASSPGPRSPRTIRSIAICEHVPPSPYPASLPVIPPPTVADLPNRQGPCLRNSSGHPPPGSHNAYSSWSADQGLVKAFVTPQRGRRNWRGCWPSPRGRRRRSPGAARAPGTLDRRSPVSVEVHLDRIVPGDPQPAEAVGGQRDLPLGEELAERIDGPLRIRVMWMIPDVSSLYRPAIRWAR